MDRIYAAIDLKSFYASVECVSRGLDPITTNLVVADDSRTEKTICLAVSPALKTFGVPGRPRLFEVVQKVREINAARQTKAPRKKLTGSSWDLNELQKDPALAVDYITAVPRMSHYMKVSGEINAVYQQYIAPEDIHVYSIDEVFIDLTAYLKTYSLSPHELTVKLIHEVFRKTGITATAGIGTNLYLAKVAMDIEAKHAEPDRDGVRIAELDEMNYRRKLWGHRPLKDFWRVGHGIADKLAEKGLYTMGDIAKCSLGKKPDYYTEELLYDFFGVNAELLIDHAWGWEPCTIADIKAYKSDTNSISSGQVLKEPYCFEDTKLIVREMTEDLVLELVSKGMQTDQVVLTIAYDAENLKDDSRAGRYTGKVKKDYYGRTVPKSAHGSANLASYTSSGRLITAAAMDLFDRIVDPELLTRHIYVIFNNVLPESEVPAAQDALQPDLFSLLAEAEPADKEADGFLEKEKRLQQSVLEIQQKFGKNAVFKGMSLMDSSTHRERNEQIGGHKS
ncbi:MAG: hypothetical protein IJI07_05375 [Flexilinea sp.]|nr:hypothetical protein [Flexilinea sp.]